MSQTADGRTERWSSDADKELCYYVQYEGIIPRLQEKLLELKGAREIVSGSEWTACRDEQHHTLIHTIDLQILYLEDCLNTYLKARRNVEAVIATELKGLKYRMFINLYWGSGLAKTEARRLVMQKMNLSQTTFYRLRKTLLSKLAGH